MGGPHTHPEKRSKAGTSVPTCRRRRLRAPCPGSHSWTPDAEGLTKAWSPSLPPDLPCPLPTADAHGCPLGVEGMLNVGSHTVPQRGPLQLTSRAPRRHRPLFPREAEAAVRPRAVCVSTAVTPWTDTASRRSGRVTALRMLPTAVQAQPTVQATLRFS